MHHTTINNNPNDIPRPIYFLIKTCQADLVTMNSCSTKHVWVNCYTEELTQLKRVRINVYDACLMTINEEVNSSQNVMWIVVNRRTVHSSVYCLIWIHLSCADEYCYIIFLQIKNFINTSFFIILIKKNLRSFGLFPVKILKIVIHANTWVIMYRKDINNLSPWIQAKVLTLKI